MKNKIYFIVAVMISLLPFNVLRVSLYRIVFNLKIYKSKIGWFSIINVDNLTMCYATIGSFNFLIGPFEVEMKEQSSIGSFNIFRCGKWAGTMTRERKLSLDEGVMIVNLHYFDLAGTILIGKKTFIAGVRSQFWTHGGFSSDVDIIIGSNCYIGSGVKFIPGSEVSNDSICAIGSVITKKFTQENVLLAGVPAKVIKKNINWRENWK